MKTPKKRAAAPTVAPARVWKRDNAWSSLSAAERQALEGYCRDYLAFLSAAKTEREAYDLAVTQAEAQGFVDLATVVAKGRHLKPGLVYRGCRGKTAGVSAAAVDGASTRRRHTTRRGSTRSRCPCTGWRRRCRHALLWQHQKYQGYVPLATASSSGDAPA